ncbi:MAG: hypothetical protein ORN98_09625, partial [Alphaproteobacteria bacterium]|nr:hypothetical protein [Alphaproteobacteria bacterium]
RCGMTKTTTIHATHLTLGQIIKIVDDVGILAPIIAKIGNDQQNHVAWDDVVQFLGINQFFIMASEGRQYSFVNDQEFDKIFLLWAMRGFSMIYRDLSPNAKEILQKIKAALANDIADTNEYAGIYAIYFDASDLADNTLVTHRADASWRAGAMINAAHAIQHLANAMMIYIHHREYALGRRFALITVAFMDDNSVVLQCLLAFECICRAKILQNHIGRKPPEFFWLPGAVDYLRQKLRAFDRRYLAEDKYLGDAA